MKKAILTFSFAYAILSANAQLKTYSSGKTYLGSTDSVPNSVLSIGARGDALYRVFIRDTFRYAGAQGLRVETNGALLMSNYGITSYVPSGGGTTYAIVGNSTNPSNGNHKAFGVYGVAGQAADGWNYGMYGELAGSRNGASVYATTNGVASVPGKYALYVNGYMRLAYDSAVKTSTNTWQTSSDKRLKKDIAPFADGLNVIRQINPVTFKFTGVGGLPNTETNIGVLAQEVQPVAPYCVGSIKTVMRLSEATAFNNDIESTFQDSSGGTMALVNTLSFNTHGLFYAMLNSIKQLDSITNSLQNSPSFKKSSENNDSLMQRIAQLESFVNQCCSSNSFHQNNNNSGNEKQQESQKLTLESPGSAILYQNEPNPFSNSTIIRYYVPETVKEAMLVFYDEFGREISKENLLHKGYARIDINSEKLAAGVYTYALVVDGITTDTKKMIKSR